MYQQNGMNASDVVRTALKNLAKKPSVIAGFKNRLGIALLKLAGRKGLVKMGAQIVKQA